MHSFWVGEDGWNGSGKLEKGVTCEGECRYGCNGNVELRPAGSLLEMRNQLQFKRHPWFHSGWEV